MSNEDSLEAKTPWGSVIAHGSTVLLLAAAGVLGWLIMIQSGELRHEHDQVECLVRLDIFVHTFEIGQNIDLRKMPSDLWNCMPSWLAQTQEQRRQ